MLIFLAARRYFSDSERSEVDKWDIPSGGEVQRLNTNHNKGASRGVRLTIKGVPSPQKLLHVLRHNPRNILQLVV